MVIEARERDDLTRHRARALLSSMTIYLVTKGPSGRKMEAKVFDQLMRHGAQTSNSLGAATGYEFAPLLVSLKRLRAAGRVRLRDDGCWEVVSING